MKDYVLTGGGEVPETWIDQNGHMNMMWYTHLVDRATSALLSRAGIEEGDSELTYVAGRVSTAHRRELRLGDRWESWSGLAMVSAESITCLHRIVSGKAIAARSEMIVVPFDRRTRASARFAAGMVAGARDYLVDGLSQNGAG